MAKKKPKEPKEPKEVQFSATCPLCASQEALLFFHSENKTKSLYGRCVTCRSLFFGEGGLFAYLSSTIFSVKLISMSKEEFDEKMLEAQKMRNGY